VAKRRSTVPTRWALQDAKNRLSEVVDAALLGQPQIVTRRGVETAVILSHDDYTRLLGDRDKGSQSFAEYLVNGPAVESNESELFERIQLKPRSPG
jgi:antitoxin Phd